MALTWSFFFAPSCAPNINPSTDNLIQTIQTNGIVHALGTTTQTASCLPGQQMIGGGYAMTSYTPPLQFMYVIPTPTYDYRNMQFDYSYSSSVQKPKPGNVVTAGGYKLYTANPAIYVSGSYPQITSSGSGESTIGWTTNTVTTYVLSSAGSLKVVGRNQFTVTPVFDQGNTTTGGGYNSRRGIGFGTQNSIKNRDPMDRPVLVPSSA